MCLACSPGSRCWRRSAWGRRARCCTGCRSLSRATGIPGRAWGRLWPVRRCNRLRPRPGRGSTGCRPAPRRGAFPWWGGWDGRGRVGGALASASLQQASARAWTVIDWLPARLTALSFAVVGSFEEAIEGWRFHAQRFPNDNAGVVLAATAGAIDVRLGGAALKAHAGMRTSQGLGIASDMDDSDATPGREPEVGHLRSVVGLVWRSVVVWMLLLALLTLARLLG